jgi:hypothetical protein
MAIRKNFITVFSIGHCGFSVTLSFKISRYSGSTANYLNAISSSEVLSDNLFFIISIY